MAYSEALAVRVRRALVGMPNIEEKRMFRGICFMVNDKMCVCVGPDNLLCYVGPQAYQAALARPGCAPMLRGDKPMKGYVFVSDTVLQTKLAFDYWLGLSLAYNKSATAAG